MLVRECLQQFCKELEAILGTNLVSITLFGSAAKEEEPPIESDINVMVILQNCTLIEITAIRKPVLKAQKRRNLIPVFWTEDELRSSSDVFPVEFMDIKENHKLLSGRDIIAEIPINTANLRHQLEFELRSKLLRLRRHWLNLTDSKFQLADFLARSGNSFLYLFSHAQKLSGVKLNETMANPFREALRLRRKGIKLDINEMETLYNEIHHSVMKMIAELEMDRSAGAFR